MHRDVFASLALSVVDSTSARLVLLGNVSRGQFQLFLAGCARAIAVKPRFEHLRRIWARFVLPCTASLFTVFVFCVLHAFGADAGICAFSF